MLDFEQAILFLVLKNLSFFVLELDLVKKIYIYQILTM